MRDHLSERGTKGTTVNHVGFRVPSVRAALARVRAAGYPIVTRQELPPAVAVIDQMAYIPDQDTYIAYVMGPDDVKVDLPAPGGAVSITSASRWTASRRSARRWRPGA